jgi:serine phosphatase RsbU (regulator of sigma subunit)
VCFKNSDKVKYKFTLEGYDNVFSNPTGDPVATYGKINDGVFTFKVIACTDDKVCSELPASITISISKPFWKTWWFYLLVIITISGATYLFIQARIKRFKAAQIYLEEQLAIKTKEVVEKADRIEEINKDLTSSINYAKRIQTAILPLEDALNKHFPNSFIFFQPRDVVSGDFYFIRQFERKLIVACCDCTGHGVPGAFMSMIGSTTLRNIYKLMENSGNWRSPEKVLELLDLEIQKILHQGDFTADLEEDYFKSRDGMDLTLCEIDLDSHLVSMSAAKRHSFIKRNGELNIFTGDKRGIGGGEVDEIDFTLSKFQMQKGDVLYLFTDGYPDQFGGPDGRKLKISGTQNLITQLEDLDSSKEYAKHISTKFNAWKGDLDQIDDVLFMGILF